jgi:hypothetical protein
VAGEIDQRSGAFDGAEGGIGDGGGRTNEGEHAAVVIRIGFAVEEDDLGNGEDGLHDGIDLGGIAAFGKIRDTFD